MRRLQLHACCSLYRAMRNDEMAPVRCTLAQGWNLHRPRSLLRFDVPDVKHTLPPKRYLPISIPELVEHARSTGRALGCHRVMLCAHHHTKRSWPLARRFRCHA